MTELPTLLARVMKWPRRQLMAVIIVLGVVAVTAGYFAFHRSDQNTSADCQSNCTPAADNGPARLPLTGANSSASSTGCQGKCAGKSSATQSMKDARFAHTATLLSNDNVLIAGGTDASGTPMANAEIYDSHKGTWSATAAMNQARQFHAATLLQNGQVLVAGGDLAGNTAELYDPEKIKWSATSDMPSGTGGDGATATLLPDGQVLVAGGSLPCATTCNGGIKYLASATLFDPKTGAWAPAGTMKAARQYGTATLLHDGRVLVAGGVSACCPYSTTTSADLFDSRTGTWTATANMATARGGHTAGLLPNGQVLVAGGRTGSCCPFTVISSAELYNPTTGTWSAAGNMSTAREDSTMAVLASGKVVVAGGWNDKNAAYSTTDLYDPSKGAWSPITNLSSARAYQTATRLSNGALLIAGGTTSGGAGSATSSAELYRIS